MSSAGRERALDRTGMVAVAASVALLVLVGASSIWLAIRTGEASRANEQVQDSRRVALNALLSLERAETGQRGFLLTGDKAYLEVYFHAVDGLPAELLRLGGTTLSAQAVSQLQALAKAKRAEMERTIQLFEEGRRDDALALVKTDVGRSLMDDYRRVSDQVIEANTMELTRLLDRVGSDTRLLVWMDAVGVLLVLALAGLIAAGVNRALGLLRQSRVRLASANAGLERANDTLEDAVRQRTADLTLANEEIQRFAYIVSHDLRSPLVNVMGFTSELETAKAVLDVHLGQDAPEPVREVLQEELPEAIRFIKTSTAKMDRLIGAILSLSREGRRRLMPEPLDMAVLLRGVADTLAHQAQDAAAEIRIGATPALTADRVCVEQIFSNVVENALKYLQPGRPGVIEVRGVARGSMVCYEVEDNGRGIAVRDLDRVFDLFRRAGDQSVPGEGIGLAHVRALVRRLGGAIFCRSQLGVGSTFVIDLPASAEQPDRAA